MAARIVGFRTVPNPRRAHKRYGVPEGHQCQARGVVCGGWGRWRTTARLKSNTFCCMSHEGEVYFQQQNITWASSKTSKWSKSKSKSEVKWNITIAYRRDWTTASTPGPIDISYTHAWPLHHWGHVICSKLVLYMSPMAYLGKAFTPKRYRTCYILQGPVFRCKFNRDVH